MLRLFTGEDKIRVTNTFNARFRSCIGETCYQLLHPEALDVRGIGGSDIDFERGAMGVDVKTMSCKNFHYGRYVLVETTRYNPQFEGDYHFMFYDPETEICRSIGAMYSRDFHKKSTWFKSGECLPGTRVPQNARFGMTVKEFLCAIKE
jgi:hypothetical protein